MNTSLDSVNKHINRCSMWEKAEHHIKDIHCIQGWKKESGKKHSYTVYHNVLNIGIFIIHIPVWVYSIISNHWTSW